MKKYFLVLIALVLSVQYSCITDQNKYKETDVFGEFETENGFTILHIPPVLFRIVFSAANDNEGVPKELLNKIEVIKLMFFEAKENTIGIDEIKKSITTKITDFNYNLLTRIAEENSDISIYVINNEDIIKEVLITIVSENEYVGINLVGELTKEDVMRVYKSINTQNIKDLEM